MSTIETNEELRENGTEKKDRAHRYSNVTLDKTEIQVDKYLTAPKSGAHTLEDYMRLKENGTIFQQEFTTIDRNNTLYAFESNGIRIKMTSRYIDGFYHDNKKINKEETLNKVYNVMVIDVQEEEKLVYVSANDANEEPRKKLRELLDTGIEQGKYRIVDAKVLGISRSKDRVPVQEICLLNIGGLGIMGSMQLSEWSRCFTPSFDVVTKVGDIVKVAVLGTARWSTMEDPVYICSRRVLIEENPWKGIEEKLHVGTMIRVTCTDKKPEYFYGKIAGFDDINVLCYYPKDPDKVIEIGKSYIGKIAKINESRKDLRVRFPNDIE